MRRPQLHQPETALHDRAGQRFADVGPDFTLDGEASQTAGRRLTVAVRLRLHAQHARHGLERPRDLFAWTANGHGDALGALEAAVEVREIGRAPGREGV